MDARLLKGMLRPPIAYHRCLADICGSVTAGLMLSQMLYWSDKGEDGWFWKTGEEWERETGLTRTEQENARKRLRDLKFVIEDRRGVPARLYFKLDESQIAGNLQTRLLELSELVCGNPAIKNAGNPQTLFSETTPKNTSPSRGDLVQKIDEHLKVHANQLYLEFPIHKGKKTAMPAIADAITRVVKGEAGRKMSVIESFNYLSEAVAEYRRECDLIEERFRKWPQGWFNDSRYLDAKYHAQARAAAQSQNGTGDAADKVRRQLREVHQ